MKLNYQCPTCRFKLKKIENHLICNKCNVSYKIKNSIPRFVNEENYTNSFGFQWNLHRKTQLDSYTGYPISRNRIFEVTGWPENMKDQVILEAGSGAGRFTEVLLGTGAKVFSFDFSSAVEANWANNGHCANLNLCQGDIFNIPFPYGSFDKVLCLGVIQHTPDPERAFKNLARQVRPGGELVIDVYTKKIASLIGWKYVLRPLTKRMNKDTLYELITKAVPVLLPIASNSRRFFGKVGAKLMPITEYSHLGLPEELNRQWSILDTFDRYSPAHDHPQSMTTVKRWYKEAGFENVIVEYGLNGIIGKGTAVNIIWQKISVTNFLLYSYRQDQK